MRNLSLLHHWRGAEAHGPFIAVFILAPHEIVEFNVRIKLKKLTIFSTLRNTRICVNSCNDNYCIKMCRDIYFIPNY